MIRMLMLAWASLFLSCAHARQIVWDERPIALNIHTEFETQLILPAPVRVRVPAAHVASLGVESFGRHVLLKPKAGAALQDVRLVLQDLADHRVLIVDVSTSANAKAEPVEIVRPAEASPTPTPTAQGSPLDPRVALVRFAAREFYAPQRLRGGLAVTRQSVTLDPVDLLDVPDVVATPLASWSMQRLHVTAVELRNTASNSLDLDPALLRGRFELAAFHSTRLLSTSGHDRTLVFLVSTRPFGEAIREH